MSEISFIANIKRVLSWNVKVNSIQMISCYSVSKRDTSEYDWQKPIFDANNHASTASIWKTISAFHYPRCMYWFDFLHVQFSLLHCFVHWSCLAETCKTFSMAVVIVASLAKFTNDFSVDLGVDRPIMKVHRTEISIILNNKINMI